MNAIVFHRLGHWAVVHRIPLLPWVCRRLIFLIFNSWVDPVTEIGPGSTFSYGGIGVVIHSDSRLGARVAIGQGVTIGGRGHADPTAPPRQGAPVIEDDVYIGPGACILGPIVVGRGALIAPNAVVIEDVPAGGVVGGVPARLLKQRPLPP
jgi:serine O-acetyltransferase